MRISQQHFRAAVVACVCIFAITGCGGGGSGSGDDTPPVVDNTSPPIGPPVDNSTVTPPVDNSPVIPPVEEPPVEPEHPPVDPVVEQPAKATLYQKLKSWDQMLVANDESLDTLENYLRSSDVSVSENTDSALTLNFVSASHSQSIDFQMPSGGAGIDAIAWSSTERLAISDSMSLPIEVYKMQKKLLLVVNLEERPITFELPL